MPAAALTSDWPTLGHSIYLHQACLPWGALKRLQTGKGSLFASTVDFYSKQVNAIDLVSAVTSTGWSDAPL